MKNYRQSDIEHIKKSLITEADLLWLIQQIKTLEQHIREKNKSHQAKAKKLLDTILKISQSKTKLETRVYACLAELRFYWHLVSGKNHPFWSLFYNDPGDRLIATMENDKTHHTFARGLATIIKTIAEEIPTLLITRISESGKKEIHTILREINTNMPSAKEIAWASQTL